MFLQSAMGPYGITEQPVDRGTGVVCRTGGARPNPLYGDAAIDSAIDSAINVAQVCWRPVRSAGLCPCPLRGEPVIVSI
jgi:hypothetical protein